MADCQLTATLFPVLQCIFKVTLKKPVPKNVDVFINCLESDGTVVETVKIDRDKDPFGGPRRPETR